MQKYYFGIILLLISAISIQAQDVRFTATAPETVQVGEQFRIVYEINDRISDFNPPQFNDFVFLSSQQGVSTINWNTTQQYVYIFKATQTGTFKINAAQAKHKGKIIESNELEIKVAAGSKPSQSASAQAQSPNVSATTTNGEELFVRFVLDKKSCYVGEQITGYTKVYTKTPLSGISNFAGPDFPGFYVQNVNVPPLRSLEQEKIGNEIYYSGVISKVNLIPQKSGKIDIEPFELNVQRDKKVRVGHFTTYQTENVPLLSKLITVNVKPLPTNKPPGFNGAIGDYSIKATISSNKLKTNDAVVFNITISGSGNIKLIDNISYKLPPTFDAFDPVIKTQLSESGLSGSKIFEITVIPRHAGEFVVKPFELVYFNPKTESFITKKTESFTLNVNKSTGDSSRVVISNLSREDVELLESDIRYIKTDTQLIKANHYFIDSLIYFLILLFSLLAFLLLLFIRREQIKRSTNIARTKHKKASRLANKRFKLARKQLAVNNIEAFYDELSKALWGYISDKLSIPLSELSTDLARERLNSKNINSEIVNNLLSLIESCEFARYAPGNTDKQPSDLLQDANKLLSKIEQNI